jgi:hypothetical protein
MGRASPTTTVELATSREVPLGGNEYRKRSSMYTAPIQEALQMIRARISTAAIVDSLAQHVLCSSRRLFGANDPPDEKYTYIHILTSQLLLAFNEISAVRTAAFFSLELYKSQYAG